MYQLSHVMLHWTILIDQRAINGPSGTFILVPRAPIINQEDRHKVAIINQTSITLLGTFLNSSDTYAVVGLLENGSRVPQFTRIQSESAADNVTLGNLEPGRTYIAEVVSVIGASSYCGRFNETDSEITSYAFCTGAYTFKFSQNKFWNFWLVV